MADERKNEREQDDGSRRGREEREERPGPWDTHRQPEHGPRYGYNVPFREPVPEGEGFQPEDPGHDMRSEFVREPVREPYRGSSPEAPGRPYERVPQPRYRGQPDPFANRELPQDRVPGQLYGHRERNWGQRRSPLYGEPEEFRNPPEDVRRYRNYAVTNPREPQGRGPHAGLGPRGYTRSDERIFDDLADTLTTHSWIDASDVSVEVDDRVVTLEGTVESRPIKHLVEDIAADVAGVEDVENRLKVQKKEERRTKRERRQEESG